MQEQLTTKQIAAALQVSESSVKRWCDRGLIPTVRTVGGHRRIPLAGFREFLERTNQQIVTPLGERVAKEAPGVGKAVAPVCEAVSAVRERFIQSLALGNEQACRKLLTDFMIQRESMVSLADDILAPAFRHLGQQWQCGDLEVYQERRACGICSRILDELKGRLPPPPVNAPLALGATPEGDQYTLPTQLVEAILQQCGWRAMNLGSNIPLASLAAAVRTHQPKLLWLSISHIDNDADFVSAYRQFHDVLPRELSVVLGGRALTDGLRPQLRYTGFCDNMQQLSSFATAFNNPTQSLKTSSA